MRGVDLARWRFDWDLTFAAVVAHHDGTVLHRYGGRDVRGTDPWLSSASLVRFLEAGLAAHGRHRPRANDREPVFLEDVPSYADKDKGECIHCHSVFTSLRSEAIEAERWRADDLWVYPPPSRIGLDLDRDDQQLVTAVEEGSLAAAAGVVVGDRVIRVGEVPVATASDLMHALHEAPAEGGALRLQLARGVETLHLEPGWKRGTPRSFAWRPSKWGLLPAPGFGGPQLGAVELVRLGLPADAFAFRVNYVVTWGPNRHLGEAARRRGLRKDHIVLGTSARRDFDSVEHFHAWWRLTLQADEDLELILWQDGAERRLPWRVIE